MGPNHWISVELIYATAVLSEKLVGIFQIHCPEFNNLLADD
jgi:hypothetical protein